MRRVIINPIALLSGALALALGDSTAAQPAALTNVYDVTAAPFGCTASASAVGADDSTCLQAAIDAAQGAGGGVVWVPAGFWNLKAQVVVRPNVTLQCVANGYVLDANTLNYASAGGAVFAVLWGAGSGASGNPAEAAFQLNRGATVRDCGFWYPGQSATASAPIEYGSTLLAYDPSGDIHQTVTGNWCANCYNFVDFRGSMAGVGLVSATVAGNIGSPIHVGLAIDYQTDWGTFRDNHWNSGAIDESDRSPNAHLRGWIENNGIGWYIGRSDWVTLINEQAWGYRTGVFLDFANPCCGAFTDGGPITLQNVQFDAMEWDVYQNGGVSQLIKIVGSTFTAFNPMTMAPGVGVGAAPGSTLNALQIEASNLFGPNGGMVSLCGAALTVGAVAITNVNAVTTTPGQSAYNLCSARSLAIVGSAYTGYARLLAGGGAYANPPVLIGNLQ